jgi:hypothetical protein
LPTCQAEDVGSSQAANSGTLPYPVEIATGPGFAGTQKKAYDSPPQALDTFMISFRSFGLLIQDRELLSQYFR